LKGSILIIGESFAPDNTPRANRWQFFSAELLKQEWTVRVVSRNLRGDSIGIEDMIHERVHRKKSFISKGALKLFSIFIFEKEILWASRRAITFLYQKKKFDEIALVIGYSLPFSGAVLALVVSKILGRSYIVEHGDPIDVNPLRRATVLEKLANKWIMRSADVVIVTNNVYAKYLKIKYNRNIEYLPPVSSIPNEVSEEIFWSVMEKSQKHSFRYTLFYAGHFYKGIRSGKEFLAALDCSQLSQLDAAFLHAGIKHKLADDLKVYHNIGYIDKSSVLYHLYCADVVLYFSNQSIYQTPSKVVEVGYMASVILAIGNSFSEFERELLGKAEYVFFVSNVKTDIVHALDVAVHVAAGIRKSIEGFSVKLEQMKVYNAHVFRSLENICKQTIRSMAQTEAESP